MATTLSTAARNAACDAVCALANGGKIRLKSAGATVIGEVSFAATAFGAAVAGVASLASAPRAGAGIAAAGAGTVATTFDVTTAADAVLWSGAVGTELILDNANIANGQAINVTAFTHTQPATA